MRVGGSQVVHADVRIIAATNQDLKGRVEAKAFREDLYYRLNVFNIVVPPLRDRREDIPKLCDHFLALIGKETAPPKRLSPAALKTLSPAGGPGTSANCERPGDGPRRAGEAIEPGDLPPRWRRRSPPTAAERSPSRSRTSRDGAGRHPPPSPRPEGTRRGGEAPRIGCAPHRKSRSTGSDRRKKCPASACQYGIVCVPKWHGRLRA